MLKKPVTTIFFGSVKEIQDILIAKIVSACGLPVHAINITEPLVELGIDSIIVSNINVEVEQEIGLSLPFDIIMNGGSIVDVTQVMFESCKANGVDKHVAETPVVKQVASIIEDMPSMVLAKSTENDLSHISESYYQIKKLPFYKRIEMQKMLSRRFKVDTPYFRTFTGCAQAYMDDHSGQLLNFATYNYLGFGGSPEIAVAAKEAIDRYGTSASSSRLVSGEKDLHRQLEKALAEFHGTEDSIIFVSGYLTNTTVIGHLMGSGDLILYDSLAHNSLITGCKLSGAEYIPFPHNDSKVLEKLLHTYRHKYERVLIVSEGLFSMDGDLCPLPELITLKQTYKAFLMIDEAHSAGVLGKTGRGICEHFKVAPDQVDITMGTLSKTFVGCGGYIAGCKELVEYLRYTAPGFVFSVGLSPVLAAASLKAVKMLEHNPAPVKALHNISQYMLKQCQLKGFNTGTACGEAIIPLIFGHSVTTIKIANYLYQHRVNVQPVIYPAVEENSARLRCFLCAQHTPEQVDHVLQLIETFLQENPS